MKRKHDPAPDAVSPDVATATAETSELLNPSTSTAPAATPRDPWPDRAITGLVDPSPDRPIPFDAVPRLRRRRNGWTEETQRAFIEALAECGCVARASRAVGMTARSAYRLLDADGADDFARAWDVAIATGIDRLRHDALDRALNGAWVAVMRRGQVVRHEHRHSDRLAIALLSGRFHSIADRREQASSRRKYRLKLKARDVREAAEKRTAEAIWAEHQIILDRIELERLNPRRLAPTPRVRRL